MLLLDTLLDLLKVPRILSGQRDLAKLGTFSRKTTMALGPSDDVK
jgi:hypothetical protein